MSAIPDVDYRALLLDKAQEYAATRMDLAKTLAAEKAAWFEAIELFDSGQASVAARKEYADSQTVGLRIEALKLQGRVDGLEAYVRALVAIVSGGA